MQTFLSTFTLITLLTLSSPFLSVVHAAKPSTLTSSSAAAKATGSSSSTDSLGSTGANSGSLDSGSWSQSSSSSSSAVSSSSTAPAKSQWIQINTPMGKITSCSTIMLSWTSGGVDGPLEIDLVSASTGDIITVQSGINPSKTTSYKWTVAVPADTYYLQGNAADFPSLIYSGNFTVSQGSSTNCVNKQAVSSSSASAASGSDVKQSATASATPSSGSTFVSGAERVVVSGLSFVGLAVLTALNL